ncbi:MAG: flagellar basal-body MS-ring/collar protein FliF [Alphaproteobacteria bacterium]|nr:flagellar basal-body MS-ring/collar protein FliF [Alphaproteobacteria bacterium]
MAEPNDLIATLARSGRMRIAAALVVTALVGGGLGVIMLRGEDGGKALLFSGLDLEEAAEMAGKLDTANIRYDLEGGGSAIFVDRAKVDDARMMLTEQGLPTRGSVGWEIFDKTEALGTTSFVQNLNKVRALEGELARTISSLDMVKAARVHLNLPDRPLFQRDSQQPTASVVLSLTGNAMGPDKVLAIRNLVATSVPGLAVNHITVVDDQGRMLAAGAESGVDGSGSGADGRKAGLEASFRSKTLEIVENIAGPGAARVQVSAEVDFNRVTQSAETYDPDSRVLRSSTTVEDTSSNTEMAPGDETTVANNVPTGAPAAPPVSQPTSQGTQDRTEETVNYEISKTTRTEIIEGGEIKRLSVAVAVDHQRVNGLAGEPPTFSPRTPEELQRIVQLVKSAVGFNEARGDTVTVENIPFARPDVSMEGAEAPGAFDFDKFDIVRGVEIGALLITAFTLVFFVLRPLVKGLMNRNTDDLPPELGGPERSTRAIANGQGDGAGGLHMSEGRTVSIDVPGPDRLDAGIDVARISGQVKASSIKKISEVVGTHPDESIAIIRSWLSEEAPERAA